MGVTREKFVKCTSPRLICQMWETRLCVIAVSIEGERSPGYSGLLVNWDWDGACETWRASR